MQILFIAVFVVLVVSLVAAIAKFAVYLSRTGTLSWKHSYFFAGFLFVLTTVVKMLVHSVAATESLPALLRAAGGLALTSVFAMYFFTHHVARPDGSLVNWAAGAKAAAVWAGLYLLLLVPFTLIMFELQR